MKFSWGNFTPERRTEVAKGVRRLGTAQLGLGGALFLLNPIWGGVFMMAGLMSVGISGGVRFSPVARGNSISKRMIRLPRNRAKRSPMRVQVVFVKDDNGDDGGGGGGDPDPDSGIPYKRVSALIKSLTFFTFPFLFTIEFPPRHEPIGLLRPPRSSSASAVGVGEVTP